MNKRLFALAVLALVLVGATSAWAQGGLTVGTVEVTVEDATGAVIPGAKVTLTSPRGTVTAETDERGVATFAGVSPGLWTIRVESANFKTAEVKDLDVRIAVRTPVIVRMEPGAITETVEVAGAAIMVDTTSTNLTASHDERLFATIPLGRGVTSTFYLGVGVNDGGGTGFANPSISGASGLENMYILDGVNITNTGFGAFGTYHRVFGPIGTGVTTSFLQEVQVNTGGYEAGTGQALGGVINVTTRSGGNDFFGAVYGYWSPNRLEAEYKQINDFRVDQNTQIVGQSQLDFGVEAGGYFIQDRLFWFGALNPSLTRVALRAPDQPTSAYSALCDSSLTLCHRLGTIDNKRRTINYAAKLTGKIDRAQNHSVEASWFGDPTIWDFGPGPGQPRGQPGRGLTGSPQVVNGAVTPTDFSRLDFSGLNWAVRYNGAITPTWVVNAHIAQAHNRFAEERFLDAYNLSEETGILTGDPLDSGVVGGIGFFENYKADTKQFYVNNLNQFNLLGQHELTLGFQFETANWNVIQERSGPRFPTPADPALIALDPSIPGRPTFGATGQLRNCLDQTGDPQCFLPGVFTTQFLFPGPDATFGTADDFMSAIFARLTRGAFAGNVVATRTRYYSFYASDTWQLTKRITLKLGLRWEEMNMFGVPGTQPTDHYAFTGNWSPRLGVIVDPLGNRKSKAYFSFSRIHERLPLDLAQRSLGGEASFNAQIWAINELDPFTGLPVFNPNGSSVYVPSNSSTPCNNGQTAVLCQDDPSVPGVGPDVRLQSNPTLQAGDSGTLILPGTKITYLDEFVLGYEHELSHGIVVRARYLDRRVKRILEDVSVQTVEFANEGLSNFNYVIANVTPTLDAGVNVRCNDASDSVFNGCPNSGFLADPNAGLPPPDGLADGFLPAVRNYQAAEISVERRLRDNWQFFANWRIARLFGNWEGSFRNDNQQEDPGITSLFDFLPSVALATQYESGLLPTDRLHIGNFYGSYMINQGWANGLNIGTNIRVQSGTPITEFLAHPQALYDNPGEVPKGGRGARGKTPVTGTVDLHFDYPWRLTERFTLRGALDLFNIFNARRLTIIDQDAEIAGGVGNVDFLTPLAFQRPFSTRISVRFEW